MKARSFRKRILRKVYLVMVFMILIETPIVSYAAGTYQMICEGDWALLDAPDIQAQMQFVFSQVYPRLIARWGRKDGTVQSSVRVRILYDETVGGYAMRDSGDRNDIYVVIGVPNNNNRRDRLAVLVHELGHVTECYDDFASDWWTEALAEYGVWRYFNWTEPQFMSLNDNGNLFIEDFSDDGWKDWGWAPYGRAELFFSYLDSRYPTMPDASGKTVYGLIDTVNNAIQDGKIHNDRFDNPEFNSIVQAITGFDNMELLRQQFVRELESGTWTFSGFAGYSDNYITEGLPGVQNPSYPMQNLADNLCRGATIFRCSGATSENTAANFVVDGSLDTKWSATAASANKADEWMGDHTQHYVVVDLGNEVTLDAYAIYHAGIHEDASLNTDKWNVFYWNFAGQNWEYIDDGYQNTTSESITTRKFSPVTTQYMYFELLNANKAGTGEANIYEIVCMNTLQRELQNAGK